MLFWLLKKMLANYFLILLISSSATQSTFGKEALFSRRFIIESSVDAVTTIDLAKAHNFKFIDTVNVSNQTLFIFESDHDLTKVTCLVYQISQAI